MRCSVWGRSWKNKKKRFPQWRWNYYGDENGLKTQKEAREHIMNLFETNKWEEGLVYSCVGLQANAPVGAWRVTSRRYGGFRPSCVVCGSIRRPLITIFSQRENEKQYSKLKIQNEK